MPKKVVYRSKRWLAWRNMMVAGINAGLEQKLFGLETGSNHWPAEVVDGRRKAFVYSFAFPGGIEALASVGDAGWDELSIHVALQPKKNAHQIISIWYAGLRVGSAFAVGWLERRNGRWLQVPGGGQPQLSARRPLQDELSGVVIKPRGYADHGKFMM